MGYPRPSRITKASSISALYKHYNLSGHQADQEAVNLIPFSNKLLKLVICESTMLVRIYIMARIIIFLALSFFLRGALGELVCEELPIKMCSFAVASSGKRCSLETYASNDGKIGRQCRTSEVIASNIREHIEKDECISACGVDRKTVGISSDYLFEPDYTDKLCSPKCQLNCLNIIDLYNNLALAEGVYLPGVCKSLGTGAGQAMARIRSSGAVYSTVASTLDCAQPPTSDPIP